MSPTLFATAALDLSPRKAIQLIAEYAPAMDPGRAEELDFAEPEPESEYRYPLGAGLPRTYPRQNQRR